MKIGQLVFGRMCGGRVRKGPWTRKVYGQGTVLRWNIRDGVIFDRLGFGIWKVDKSPNS